MQDSPPLPENNIACCYYCCWNGWMCVMCHGIGVYTLCIYTYCCFWCIAMCMCVCCASHTYTAHTHTYCHSYAVPEFKPSLLRVSIHSHVYAIQIQHKSLTLLRLLLPSHTQSQSSRQTFDAGKVFLCGCFVL